MRRFLSIVVLAFCLCAAALAGRDLDALQAKAENGDAEAQLNLGIKYDLGEDVPRDNAEAAKWYCKAAEQKQYYGRIRSRREVLQRGRRTT